MSTKPKKYAFGGIAGAPTTPNPGMGVTPPNGATYSASRQSGKRDGEE